MSSITIPTTGIDTVATPKAGFLLRPLSRAKETIQDCARAIGKMDPLDGAAKMTLVLLALYSGKFWDIRVPMAVFASLGLVIPRLVRQPVFWLVIAGSVALANARRVFIIDNHKVLMVWWAVAVFASVSVSRVRSIQRDVLARNATLLVGLCFLFATFWKAYTADFADGSFLHFTLLQDGRFANFSAIVGGLTPTITEANSAALAAAAENPGTAVEVSTNPMLLFLGKGLSWWTLFIEGAIAITFLGSLRFKILHRLRNLTLLAFLFTTYAIATVIGFGWLLAILGFAQCRRDEWLSRIGYIAAFVVLQLFTVPWSRVLGLA